MGLLSLVLPLRCAVCERPGDALCGVCLTTLVPVGPTGCARCGAPGPWPIGRCAECAGRRLAFDSARAAFLYRGAATVLVRSWKEQGRRDLATPLASLVAREVVRPEVDALTFVPGQRDRARARGHVPARGLAEALAPLWGIPWAPLLERVPDGHRARQVELARRERTRGARRLYAPSLEAPARVCLVDDVYTTGATADACAAALRQAGASSVCVVTLARAVR